MLVDFRCLWVLAREAEEGQRLLYCLLPQFVSRG
jgi:hypothetical protein